MKKSVILCAALFLTAVSAQAQLAKGGLPVSLRDGLSNELVPPKVISLAAPDWEAYLIKEQQDQERGLVKPMMAALFTPAQIQFPESGTFTPLADGGRLWRTALFIQDAPAIGLYFDRFHLPEGAELFLMNQNKRQILGAYTKANNSETNLFAIEPVQGDRVLIEMYIPDGTDISELAFSIDKAAVYHRAIENLRVFVSDSMQLIDAIDDQLNGKSSVCMINSVCPQANGFDDTRKSTLQVLTVMGSQGVGACSGTLVNTTTNSETDCKKYVLYASHCDGGSGTAASQFSQSIFRFNFEHDDCAGSTPPVSNTITGGTFVARSITPQTPQQIDGDFLLVQLTQNIPESWDVKIAGWNRDPNIPTSVSPPAKFIGFHHPDGDNKKLATYQAIQSDGLAVANSHWSTITSEGYVSTGSSGSGLFNNQGNLIGVASVAGQQSSPANCHQNAAGSNVYAMDVVAYSKLSHAWDYATDGNENSMKLAPWLDPNNSGVMTLAGTNSSCTDGGNAINTHEKNLDNAIAIYPNPVSSGAVTIQFNLEEQGDLNLELLDVNGRSLNQYQLNSVKQGQFRIQTNGLANGMYLLKITHQGSSTTKKIMLRQ